MLVVSYRVYCLHTLPEDVGRLRRRGDAGSTVHEGRERGRDNYHVIPAAMLALRVSHDLVCMCVRTYVVCACDGREGGRFSTSY